MTEIDEFLAEWTAAEQAGDPSALDKLLTADFLAVGPLGFTLTKREWLDRHEGGLRYESFGLQEVQARRYGDGAVVGARQVGPGPYQGKPGPAPVRATPIPR